MVKPVRKGPGGSGLGGERGVSKPVTIRYRVEVRGSQVKTLEKTFPSEGAMQKWVQLQEETNPKFIEVLAYST